jgi:hypothetical protein
MANHACHGSLAGSFLAIAQDLRKKGPHQQRRGVYPMKPEQAAMLLKDPFDAFGRKHLGERKAVLAQERIQDLLEIASVTAWRIWYRYGHEKSPPWLFTGK